MKKYKIHRSFGDLDKQVRQHELVAVEVGESIDAVSDAFFDAVKNDLAELPEHIGCECGAYAPEPVKGFRKVRRYQYEIAGRRFSARGLSAPGGRKDFSRRRFSGAARNTARALKPAPGGNGQSGGTHGPEDGGARHGTGPVFSYNGATEDIADLNQTFDELRETKAEDFPEFDEAKNVSWSVTYGKISKSVVNRKKAKIGEFKREVEASKEFLDALKKSTDKKPKCIMKPRVYMEKKGISYKGIFPCLEEA